MNDMMNESHSELQQSPKNEVFTSNPFQESAPTTSSRMNSTTSVEAQRAMAEIQGAVFMAKQFPRDPCQCYNNIMKACQRPKLAECAIYNYPRGGMPVTGPSIRLAEMLAQEWGNVNYGYTELEQTRTHTIAQAYAWNLENNVRVTRVVTIPHERHTKRGVTILTDPRDIYELVANQMARRIRACILEVIPGDVTEAAVKACEETMRANVDITPEKIRALTDSFAQYGVTRPVIEKYIQRSIEAITAGNVLKLRTIFQSIKDGIGKPEDYFDMSIVELAKPEALPAPKVDAMKNQLLNNTATIAEKGTRKTKKNVKEPEIESEPTVPETRDFTWFMEEIERAGNMNELDALHSKFTVFAKENEVADGDYLTIENAFFNKGEALKS